MVEFLTFCYFLPFFPEPTNNIAPKLVGERSLGRIMSAKSWSNVYMLCQIIGYPSPIYRFVIYIVICVPICGYLLQNIHVYG